MFGINQGQTRFSVDMEYSDGQSTKCSRDLNRLSQEREGRYCSRKNPNVRAESNFAQKYRGFRKIPLNRRLAGPFLVLCYALAVGIPSYKCKT